MEYRAVGNRCAVCLDDLGLPISNAEALAILTRKGFHIVDVDLVAIARACIGVLTYRRGAKPSEAPEVVDCSSFVKWLYELRGVWLPRRSIQQHALGETVPRDTVTAGDLVFTSGWNDYYHDDPANGVGHVGIATGWGTVIHAKNKKEGVVENPLDEFSERDDFRGARRYIPRDKEVLTLETPIDREIEIADDIKWIVLQSLLVTIERTLSDSKGKEEKRAASNQNYRAT